MKKFVRILSVIFALACITALFAACKDKEYNIPSGTYYSVENEERYIELTDETITFHNIDFPEIEQEIFKIYEEHVDVAQLLAGEQPYVKANGAPIIFVIVEDYNVGPAFHYDSSENALLYGGEKFVMREE